jgi:hypothetical protein
MRLWALVNPSTGYQHGFENGKVECGARTYRWDGHEEHNASSRGRQKNLLCWFAAMTCVLILIIFALLSFGAVIPEQGPAGLRRPLQFAADGTFQISIFEDLHFGESKQLGKYVWEMG